jgi:hypothetical protein
VEYVADFCGQRLSEKEPQAVCFRCAIFRRLAGISNGFHLILLIRATCGHSPLANRTWWLWGETWTFFTACAVIAGTLKKARLPLLICYF